ncbi:diguanylate cyclase [Aquisalimonas sp. 2447]|uniref:sensor domain-containing diguanylate cyclase n=1 Tax=Aquisalimonas sp. 2447 TaxID=2740807 RepID=UPI0014323D95|nr:diguanylate cyclase [Aquisalimonas sp. 2447]QIT56728.1 diguanylate cyclase [Aquisalimonas sp. 2447]
MTQGDNRPGAAGRAARFALIYAFLGILWIGFSDQAVDWLFAGTGMLTTAQTIKGWLFVAATATIFFIILRGQFRRDSVKLAEREGQRRDLEGLSQFREAVIDNASIWINVVDREGRVTLWNTAAEQISGYTRDEVLGSAAVWDWLYPEAAYQARVMAAIRDTFARGEDLNDFETRITAREGAERLICWSSRRLYDSDGGPLGVVAIGSDVTRSREMEQALEERERELATLMANLPGMAYRCLNDDSWTMKYVSEGCRALTGYAPEELIDNQVVAFGALVRPDDLAAAIAEIQRAIAEQRPYAFEYRLHHRAGHELWVWEQGRAEQVAGETRLEGIVMDIDQRKQMEQALAALAIRDPLTGLYNRREFDQQFAEEVERARRYQRPLALIWLDVDEFKAINDTHGHLAGDDVLRALAGLVRDNIRNVDYAARYGGEELAVVMPEMTSAEAEEGALRLRDLVASRPLPVEGGGDVRVTVSIGVAAFPEHGDSAEDLLAAADTAMYAAKRSGRNRVRLA